MSQESWICYLPKVKEVKNVSLAVSTDLWNSFSLAGLLALNQNNSKMINLPKTLEEALALTFHKHFIHFPLHPGDDLFEHLCLSLVELARRSSNSFSQAYWKTIKINKDTIVPFANAFDTYNRIYSNRGGADKHNIKRAVWKERNHIHWGLFSEMYWKDAGRVLKAQMGRHRHRKYILDQC